jgi:uncharacterized membrane protein YhhN
MCFETVIFGLILVAICSFCVTLFLKAFYHKRFKAALLYKGLASLCFIIFGAINFFTTEFSFVTLVIFIGLCWGIIGDEIIAVCQIHPKHDTLFFLGGGACFIVGHVLYIVAMLLLGKPSIIGLIIAFVCIVILCVVYESRRKFLIGKMKNSLKLYIGIVIFFTAIGIATFLKRGTVGSALFALGGALFTVSDNILFAFKFGARPRYYQNVALHIAYYLAQFMIAWSIVAL